MQQIGAFELSDVLGRTTVEGQSTGRVDGHGSAIEYSLTGPGGLHLTLRDVRWASGERDVGATERHTSPETFDTLVGRLRLGVLSAGGGVAYVELRQARRRGTRASVFKARVCCTESDSLG